MTLVERCAYCGIIIGTRDDLGRGGFHSIYGAHHSDGCPHSKDYKKFLINEIFNKGVKK